MNFRGTNQIFELVNINAKIQQLGGQIGIQPQNMEGFRNGMMEQIGTNLPKVAADLIQQEAPNTRANQNSVPLM